MNISANRDMRKVKKIAYMETLSLLLIHCLLFVFFSVTRIWFMVGINCISVPLYIICFLIIHKKRYTMYLVVSYLEITLHMFAAVICLGWGYGFQLYMFAFIPSLYYQYYIVSRDRQRRLPIELVRSAIIVALIFVALRVYTYMAAPIYKIMIPNVDCIASVINAMITFGFVIFYQFHYLSMVSKSEFALKVEADYDALTHVYNRRRMEFLLEELYSKAQKGFGSFSLSILDIDDFKAVNDTYGHEAGDYVLRSMSSILQYVASKEDNETIIGRWGGEEFLILQRYGMFGDGSEDTLERFREQIDVSKFQYNKKNISITVTIGTTEFIPNVTIHEMIKLADNNLYQGKRRGKNQVVA